MSNFFRDLVNATNNVAKIGDIGDRVIGVQIGRVTDVDDPENMRRIKVELEAYPGQSTDWLECFAPIVNCDPPLPKLGQLTMVQFINGDPHRGIWQGVKIDPTLNPSYNQNDPKYDRTDSVEGDTVLLNGGNYIINCLETLQFNINNISSFTLSPDGECTLASKVGVVKINKDGKITLTVGSTVLDVNTSTINIDAPQLNLNYQSLTANGLSVIFDAQGAVVNGIR
jgi:phage baseplate assembly protein gpV